VVTLVDAAGNVVGTTITEPDGSHTFTDLDGREETVIAGGHRAHGHRARCRRP
jgi:hypothetical protein